MDTTEPSQGDVRLVFAPEGRGDGPLTAGEMLGISWFIRNQESLSEAALRGLLLAYASLAESYDYSDEERSEWMPSVSEVSDFRRLIGLHSVNVHPLVKDGIPYIGLEFGCTWDIEHGLGILMHGDRVVHVGGADTAILLWLAEQDAGLKHEETGVLGS